MSRARGRTNLEFPLSWSYLRTFCTSKGGADASTQGYLGIDATNHDTSIEASSVVGFDDLASHNFCGADRAVECLRRSCSVKKSKKCRKHMETHEALGVSQKHLKWLRSTVKMLQTRIPGNLTVQH